ncbi:MAG: hypothetical protein DRO11_07795 [Methanobacteriota archaeon]|nr:MAG: hypothetical protein DRO11_07795 [Euryarchaeota archaeon]
MELGISSEVGTKFPGVEAPLVEIRDVKIQLTNKKLEELKDRIVQEVRKKLNIEDLGKNPVLRLYRNFFWRVGIDPTKKRPANEALLRRVLRGNPLPRVNTLVDCYNLVSLQSCVPIAAFDLETLCGGLTLRFAREGETFLGIGMEKPVQLKGCELVVADEEKLVAIYPYRDAEETKVTTKTRDVLIMVCGVPGVDKKLLGYAKKLCVEWIPSFCGGTPVETPSSIQP